MKSILAVFVFLVASFPVSGRETLSYLYIQGDKQTPFYVKLEDEMQPRFGKNYCIIPQLAPGPAHIEILFQQNVFPAQKFTVLIPESGSRGFLLVKKEEGFSLYDLQQGFYLPAGNSEGDDHLPVSGTVATALPVADPPVKTDTPRTRPTVAVRKQPVKKEPRKTLPPKKSTVTVARKTPTKEGPAFIPGIELSKSTEGNGETTAKTVTKPSVVIANSDCPTAISSDEFGKIFSSMSAKGADEDRLSYVLDKMDVCYESWQARALTQMLSGDAARFTLLKRIFPRITDQAAFPLLDDLLTSDAWKAEFARLTHH